MATEWLGGFIVKGSTSEVRGERSVADNHSVLDLSLSIHTIQSMDIENSRLSVYFRLKF
jgi:hypothetical protein